MDDRCLRVMRGMDGPAHGRRGPTRLVVVSKSFSAVVLSAKKCGLGKGADSESRQDVRGLARDLVRLAAIDRLDKSEGGLSQKIQGESTH